MKHWELKIMSLALISQFYCEISIKYGQSQANSQNTFNKPLKNHQCEWKITSSDFSAPKSVNKHFNSSFNIQKINKTGFKISKRPSLKQ